MFRFEGPFLRGIVGGFLGMFVALMIAVFAYGWWIVYTDHQALVQVVQILNKLAQQPAP
jgi:predicted PurR-regulated permease PerM